MQPLCNIFELQGDPSIPGNGEMDPASFHSQISPPKSVTKFLQKNKKYVDWKSPLFFFQKPH